MHAIFVASLYRLIDENKDFLVVDKQPEVSIHDEDHSYPDYDQTSITNQYIKNNSTNKGLIKQLRIDFDIEQIAPVHRLDKPTSGLLLCAKNSHCASVLSQAFQHREIEKYYLALSTNKPIKKQGLICGDMLRTRNGSWKLSKTTQNPAITQFFSYSLANINGDKGRLFILKPHTGKTHQLRVALKTISAPILGDRRYQKSVDANTQQRMHLHAYVLRFIYNNTEYAYSTLPSGSQFTPELVSYIEEIISHPWLLEWPKLPAKLAAIVGNR